MARRRQRRLGQSGRSNGARMRVGIGREGLVGGQKAALYRQVTRSGYRIRPFRQPRVDYHLRSQCS